MSQSSKMMVRRCRTTKVSDQKIKALQIRTMKILSRTWRAAVDLCMTLPFASPLGYGTRAWALPLDVMSQDATSSLEDNRKIWPSKLSNVHFRIYLNQGGILMLEDTSSNGTFVDGTQLWASKLGQRILSYSLMTPIFSKGACSVPVV